MTLNVRNVTIAEIRQFYGAHHKNFNKDRSILSAAKRRCVILVSRNIRHMLIVAGVPRGGGVKYKTYTCVQTPNSVSCLAG